MYTQHKKRVKNYFDGRAEDWDQDFCHPPTKLVTIADYCRIAPGQRILDAACGTGMMTPALLGTPAGEIKGIDISGKMIDQAKSKFKDCRLGYERADLYEFSETGWHVVLIFNAFPHLMDRSGLVAKLKELLVPGGRFVVAHSQGPNPLNHLHAQKAGDISFPLGPAEREARIFENVFIVDTLIDREDLYVISGVLD